MGQNPRRTWLWSYHASKHLPKAKWSRDYTVLHVYRSVTASLAIVNPAFASNRAQKQSNAEISVRTNMAMRETKLNRSGQ